ncbi:hypothetical protein IW261DRAFT_1423141 [Armillaria novae-zelandiae]|uniref:Uncharacterized protein n=1 Tax=Armillaria novae-zelandiae TaxID=153914 RepID=A0AA39U4R4_9AGAR|nr:hypothetical protein IW261DRAFT_1423141 [Armillaria novae-zelandiae]
MPHLQVHTRIIYNIPAGSKNEMTEKNSTLAIREGPLKSPTRLRVGEGESSSEFGGPGVAGTFSPWDILLFPIRIARRALRRQLGIEETRIWRLPEFLTGTETVSSPRCEDFNRCAGAKGWVRVVDMPVATGSVKSSRIVGRVYHRRRGIDLKDRGTLSSVSVKTSRLPVSWGEQGHAIERRDYVWEEKQGSSKKRNHSRKLLLQDARVNLLRMLAVSPRTSVRMEQELQSENGTVNELGVLAIVKTNCVAAFSVEKADACNWVACAMSAMKNTEGTWLVIDLTVRLKPRDMRQWEVERGQEQLSIRRTLVFLRRSRLSWSRETGDEGGDAASDGSGTWQRRRLQDRRE